MKRFLYCILFSAQLVTAQKLKKADKLILTSLHSAINYLASDSLEGRRTGTRGEKLAYEYVVKEFRNAGLNPKGDKDSYLQQFDVPEGKKVTADSHLNLNGNELAINSDYFPLSFSSNGQLNSTASISLQEYGTPWFYDLKDLLEAHKNDPHFNLNESIKKKAADAGKKKAAALILFNSSILDDELVFESGDKTELCKIPVIYISKAAKHTYLKDETASVDIKLKIEIINAKRIGHNVLGFLNNNAEKTIVIGAHYDHLGFGEDNTSLFRGATPQIHNGADDNASGTAAVLELVKLLKTSKFKRNNYLFICFSGEELGLFGSKYFTANPTINLSTINYMLNMDMVGRLNDSTHGLIIGGFGTSPAWSQTISGPDNYFHLKIDSSGTGPSDHTSFYRKNIPVLYFFTGLHSDYHKPTDDADKINYTGELMIIKFIYKLIENLDKKEKLTFTKTRETIMDNNTSFKVTLGIMPDYAFSGIGVRADGISEGKAAQKAGIITGDIILQLGDYPFTDLQSYMVTLNKFNKGDAAKVKVQRGTQILEFNVVF